MATIILKMEQQTTVDGKRVATGKTYDCPIFTLDEFGITAEVKETDKDGIPTYADDRIEWVWQAVIQGVKKAASNRQKSDKDAAATVAELIAPSEGGGAAMRFAKEFREAFAAFMATTDKTQAVQAALVGLIASGAKGIQLASPKYKTAASTWLTKFAGYLDDAGKAKFGDHIITLVQAAEEEELDLE